VSWRDRIANAFIRAYHGSPHDFDRFDLSKLGTGEGAQSYGRGLYFSENPQVAKSYRDSLTDLKDRTIAGTDLRMPSWVAKSLEAGQNPAELLADFRGRVRQAQEEMKTAHDPWNYPGKIEGLSGVADAIDAYSRGAELAPAGRMYEVDISAHPEQFLQWDKPLEQQPEAVQKLVATGTDRLRGNTMRGGQLASPTGEDIYRRLAIEKADAAPKVFNAFDIPGVRYLDQGSRTAGEGTYNYSVWNPDLINIVNKYGIAAAVMPPAIGALATQDQYGAAQ